MDFIKFWNSFHLHRKKRIAFLGCYLLIIYSLPAQRIYSKKIPKYDSKKFHYGFFVAGYLSKYKVTYSDYFTNPSDTTQSIRAILKPGFSLGFIANIKATNYLDVRLIPSFSFYENSLEYRFNQKKVTQLVESSFLDFSVLVKYKTVRRKNFRLYIVGGGKGSIQLSNKKPLNNTDQLFTRNNNFTIEYGVGTDLYFQLFKFAPELRFSHGIPNMLSEPYNAYSQPIKKLTTHAVTLYLFFE